MPSWFDDNPPVSRDTPTSVGAPVPFQSPGLQPSVGGSDPQALFNSLFPGGTLTPQDLAAKEAELKAAGIRLLGPNAAGMRTKLELPNGQIVDAIGGAGSGLNQKQWLVEGGGGSPTLSSIGGGPAAGGGVDYTKRQGTLADTPGFKFRFDQGIQAIQNSAAAKGTLLTGGVLKDLATFGQGLASTEYQNEWDRTKGLAELGFNAATNQGAYGSQYGAQLTDLTTGAGNAQAAGTVASGNAWSGAIGNIGQGALDAWGLYRYGPQQQGNQARY